jgi:hypothetical protein
VPPTLAMAQGNGSAEVAAVAAAAAATAAAGASSSSTSSSSLSLPPPASTADAAYRLMLEVLVDRPSFRKTDLQSAIKAASLGASGSGSGGSGAGAAPTEMATMTAGDASSLSEAQLTRVVKVLCRSKGNQWCLRDG